MTVSGEPMNDNVAALPSLRAGKLRLNELTIVLTSPLTMSSRCHCPMHGPHAFAPEQPGLGVDARDGSVKPLPDLAREYKEADVEWVAVGDENYGEGSSREHAAMEPRYMNGRAVIVRSFARIHEANLKKQGVLALTFADPADYEKFRLDDAVDVVGLAELAPGKPVTVVVHHADGSSDEIPTTHTMSEEHIEWFRAGSALNVLRQQS